MIDPAIRMRFHRAAVKATGRAISHLLIELERYQLPSDDRTDRIAVLQMIVQLQDDHRNADRAAQRELFAELRPKGCSVIPQEPTAEELDAIDWDAMAAQDATRAAAHAAEQARLRAIRDELLTTAGFPGRKQ